MGSQLFAHLRAPLPLAAPPLFLRPMCGAHLKICCPFRWTRAARGQLLCRRHPVKGNTLSPALRAASHCPPPALSFLGFPSPAATLMSPSLLGASL